MLAVTSENVSIALAFAGGFISFVSPCVLPIVPGYVSLITGLSVTELQEGGHDQTRHVIWNTALFVAGFTFVFVGLGLLTTSVGNVLVQNQVLLTRIAGVMMIAMACYLAGSQILMKPGLYREARFHPNIERFGWFASPIAGAAFGFGWTPCLGPILGSVLTVAATQGEVWRGGALLLAYGLGLGVPFLLVGLLLGRLTGTMRWVARHGRVITFVSATILGAFGVVLLFNQLPWVTGRITDLLDGLGLRSLIRIG
ncbi:MAG: cytochrome c biogenesis CcdA family protein [Acidimicrobiia bacterium]